MSPTCLETVNVSIFSQEKSKFLIKASVFPVPPFLLKSLPFPKIYAPAIPSLFVCLSFKGVTRSLTSEAAAN